MMTYPSVGDDPLADLLPKLQAKAALLKAALTANMSASTAFHQARTAWATDTSPRTQQDAMALLTKEEAWDTSRDAVISAAQSLLDTAHILLRLSQPREYVMLGQQAASLQVAFNREVKAFTRHSRANGLFRSKAHEVWVLSKEQCVQSAFHLMYEAMRLPTPLPSAESQIDTELDDTPAPTGRL